MVKKAIPYLVEEAEYLLSPLFEAASSIGAARELLWSMGWNIDLIVGFSVSTLQDSIGQFKESYSSIRDIVDGGEVGLVEIVDLLENLGNLTQSLQSLGEGLIDSGGPDLSQMDELGKDLLQFLFVNYLNSRQPDVFQALVLLGIATEAKDASPTQSVTDSDGNQLRKPVQLPTVDFSQLESLFKDPIAHLTTTYLPSGSIGNQEEAEEFVALLGERLQKLLIKAGIIVRYGMDANDDNDYGAAGAQIQKRSLSIFQYSDLVHGAWGFTLIFSPVDSGHPGVFIVPMAAVSYSRDFARYKLTLSADAEIGGFFIGEEGFQFPTDFSSSSLNLRLNLARLASYGQPAFQIGSSSASRFSIGQADLDGFLKLSTEQTEYGFLLRFSSGALVIAPGDGDGFIAKILPEEGMTTTFDLALGWSNTKGFHFDGAAGFDLTIPVYQTLLGFLSLDTIRLSLAASGSGIDAYAAVSGGLDIGPFTATVSEVGLQAQLSFPEDGGNIGPLQLDLEFKPPTAIGLAIDATVVKGGGFLGLEPENNRYYGSLELTVAEVVSLKAIAILNTQMPDGSKGYSLLLLVTAEFTPIQLGMGFTLNGVGGLIGAHRTMLIDALQDGVRSGSIDRILFPDDPVGQANEIISDLETIFPIQQDQFVFGPMGLLGWGTPTLVELKMGLILSLPDPVTLAILGTLSMVLPDEDLAIATIKVSFVGAIDFDKGELSFDASLFGSKILTWTLSGDMAVRLGWGDNPAFVLSVGGFHPDFEPPSSDLANMERVTLNLLSGDNPRLTLAAYFALTSNSFQFGASIDFYYSCKAGISVTGYLGFDALFQFSPFWFKIAVGASLAVMKKDKALMSIYVGGSLEGPTPWRVTGTAEFKVLGFKIKVKFDKSFGQADSSTFPDVDVTSRLVEALRDQRNWLASRPNGNQLVSYGSLETEEDEIVAYPDGKLGLSQKIVPLNLEIDLFGNQKPQESKPLWTLTLYNSDGERLEDSSSKAHFAPSQFFERSETQKVTGASFEEMDAGIEAQTGSELQGDFFLERESSYDETILDEVKSSSGRYQPSRTFSEGLLRKGAAKRSALGSSQKLGSTLGPAKVQTSKSTFAVVSTSDLSSYQGLQASSAIEAEQLLVKAISENPLLKNELQVIPASEIE